jgi:hypothetical protein
MSLREQFEPDLDAVWFNPDEFGEDRRFAIAENGIERTFTTFCVWDKSEVQRRMIVQQQGVYIGDVMLYIHKDCFSVEPKPEELLYTWEGPVRKGYRIVQVVDAESCYEMALDKLMG